jgi:hypothetical protein
MKNNNKIIFEMIDQQLDSMPEARTEPNDHEGQMAKSELRDMLKNGLSLYKNLNEDDELPAWVSSYISLACDYIHTVSQFIEHDKQPADVGVKDSDI